MATGTVKWFSDEKGFGFITPDDQGKDLFVHHTGIAGSGFKSLAEGAKVSYDAEDGPQGPERGERPAALSPARLARLHRRPARAGRRSFAARISTNRRDAHGVQLQEEDHDGEDQPGERRSREAHAQGSPQGGPQARGAPPTAPVEPHQPEDVIGDPDPSGVGR